ncbi:hypothetical protein H8D36_00230 [archaeon]|nr:hypothetical protein [archaeon]
MIIEQREHKDFSDLQERPLEKHGRTISLILPALNEYKTIGNYFPAFANLMALGCIDEIIIADSSSDMRTIDAALESAVDTHPFSDMIHRSISRGTPLPVKAVNVFDPTLTGIYNGHKPDIGTIPGKGTAMYLGMAIASGDILIFLDSDFQNIDPHFVYGLAGPFEDKRTILSKATFELEDTYQQVLDECARLGTDPRYNDTLLKSVNSRTLAKPMMETVDTKLEIFPGISGFNGPLSGGVGAAKEVWHSLKIPKHYGIEVSYLMQLAKKFPNGHYAYDVNLGEVMQESQDAEGRVRMGQNIISTLLHHLQHEQPALYEQWRQNPSQFTNIYLENAGKFAVHNSDPERMELYAGIMTNILSNGERINVPILPALNQNTLYLGKEEQFADLANKVTIERINSHKAHSPTPTILKRETVGTYANG